MAKEVELKLIATPTELATVMGQPWVRAIATGKPRKQKLVSTYFDTANGDLRRHGISLRVRKIGTKRLQTVKAAGNGTLGAPDRDEWEQEIAGELPDPAFTKNTAAAPFLSRKDGHALQPVFETVVERMSLPLRWGESEIELAIDRGWISTGGRRERIGEIELELKRGDPADLAKITKQFAETLPVSYGALAKAERGYALSTGNCHAPVKAAGIHLASDQSCGAAFTAIGLSCLHHFAANEEAIRNGDYEGIHQMRVGLRRLRAAISLFKEMLAGPEADGIKTDLKWLTDELGPARDFDVLLNDSLLPLRDARPDQREIGLLTVEIEHRRDKGLSDAKSALATDRYRRTVLNTALWLSAGKWLQSDDALVRTRRERAATDFARERLPERTKKILKKSRQLQKRDARSRHKLRISVKKLRYATEFFASLFAERKQKKVCRRFADTLKSFQESLGKLSDIAGHEKLAHAFAGGDSRGAADSRLSYAMGYLIAQEQKKLPGCVAAANKARRRLSDASPFW
ncbi:MAG TPA: CHAD domain-containing protein [Rhizomicrobium sp.]|jgi:inorganic triphosphatase YgiF